MEKPVSKTTSMSSSESFLLIILLISMVISTPPSFDSSSVLEDHLISMVISTPPSSPSSSVLEDQDQTEVTEHINHTPLSTDPAEQPSSCHTTRLVPVLETITPTASSPDTLSSSSPSSRTPTNAEKPIHTNYPASSLHNGIEFPRADALDMSVPPASNPSPSFQTHRVPQPFLDVNHNSDLLQTSCEATMVIDHTKITLIPDYFARITKHHDDIAESSNSEQHEKDEEYVIVDEHISSEDPVQKVNHVREAIERTLKKYLSADRRAHTEDDQLSYELISHELLRILGIGFQINIYIPLKKYLKQVLDKLPEGSGAGIEYADAIEEIAHKLLQIAAAMKGN